MKQKITKTYIIITIAILFTILTVLVTNATTTWKGTSSLNDNITSNKVLEKTDIENIRDNFNYLKNNSGNGSNTLLTTTSSAVVCATTSRIQATSSCPAGYKRVFCSGTYGPQLANSSDFLVAAAYPYGTGCIAKGAGYYNYSDPRNTTKTCLTVYAYCAKI